MATVSANIIDAPHDKENQEIKDAVTPELKLSEVEKQLVPETLQDNKEENHRPVRQILLQSRSPSYIVQHTVPGFYALFDQPQIPVYPWNYYSVLPIKEHTK